MNSFPAEPSHSENNRNVRISIKNCVELFAVLCGGIAIGWTCALGCASRSSLNYPLMQQAAAVIQHEYVDHSELQSTSLTYGAISGMINSLGDYGHSTFLSPAMVKEL